ncbi:hypothetical protein GOD90_16925 [Sinorhizobium medicae]|uniref:hypothetical protein n=1 Tax=Sinorhizobium medicae TaxID=110321 RepID=UPI0002E23F41|nr:hypothetical protein [Sinorhizobium medicae]MDX0480562.1 hypothetical protein [Sinorhizobium medicae]MDX0838035.1 hypothetical protein [Sinorhizobium medicae]MDX0851377.1 hypothetical protein [Sinorhizobium medicae]MDX0898656.1 hypothetical protein [Sinorhizobium medicae]MDX1046574.1 hypothetical protein [Sinorhizobium medicae]
MTNTWQRDEAEARIRDVLNAAKARGPQKVVDPDGIYSIVFAQRKQSLEKLLSKPGRLHDDDIGT